MLGAKAFDPSIMTNEAGWYLINTSLLYNNSGGEKS